MADGKNFEDAGDARFAEMFEGVDIEKWIELSQVWKELPIQGRVSLLSFARELARGRESARTIGLAEVMAEADAVIALNQDKNPNSIWREKSPDYHLGKFHTHAGRAIAGEWNADTGRPHLAHALVRFAMYVGLLLEKRKAG